MDLSASQEDLGNFGPGLKGNKKGAGSSEWLHWALLWLVSGYRDCGCTVCAEDTTHFSLLSQTGSDKWRGLCFLLEGKAFLKKNPGQQPSWCAQPQFYKRGRH